jgi:D-inositol-3-phosphate glycosyltransferase
MTRIEATWSIVGPTFPFKGGIAQHTTELAHRLSSRSIDVTIESWDRQYPNRLYPGVQQIDEPECRPFEAVERRLSWNRPDSWVSTGRRLGQSADVIVFVVTTPFQIPSFAALLWSLRREARRKRRAKPVAIAIVHNVLPHESRRLDVPMTSRFLRSVDGAVVHSEAEAEQARLLGGSHVVTSGLPFFFHGPLPIERDTNVFNKLAFVGFVRPYKGLDVLLHALQRSKSRPELEVRGEFWQDSTSYTKLADELGLTDRCRFVAEYATSTDLAGTIDSSDALVLPYRSGTGSQLPRIAFSRGVPVLATSVGDLPTQIRDGVDGLLCAPGDPDSLAEAIDELYAEGTLTGLRRNVRAPDVDREWEEYLNALDQAAECAPD